MGLILTLLRKRPTISEVKTLYRFRLNFKHQNEEKRFYTRGTLTSIMIP